MREARNIRYVKSRTVDNRYIRAAIRQKIRNSVTVPALLEANADDNILEQPGTRINLGEKRRGSDMAMLGYRRQDEAREETRQGEMSK